MADPIPSGPLPVDQTDNGIPIYDEGAGEPAPADLVGDITDAEPIPEPHICERGTTCSGIYCDVTNTNELTNIKNDYVVEVNEVLQNGSNTTVGHDVKVSKSYTIKYSLSVEVEATFKAWIFSEVKAKVNGGVEKTYSTSVEESVHVNVKPHKQYTVKYSIAREKVHYAKIHVDKQCKETTSISGTAAAPYEALWNITQKNL